MKAALPEQLSWPRGLLGHAAGDEPSRRPPDLGLRDPGMRTLLAHRFMERACYGIGSDQKVPQWDKETFSHAAVRVLRKNSRNLTRGRRTNQSPTAPSLPPKLYVSMSLCLYVSDPIL
jgi:hypothetical protein